MATILLAIGLVLVIEGLVYALAPWLIDSMLEALRDMSQDQRRMAGLVALALGVGLVWLAKTLGA